MCISLGPLEPYAIIGLILSHYGAAAAVVAVSDVGELKTPLECERKLASGEMWERASGFRRAVTHIRGVCRQSRLWIKCSMTNMNSWLRNSYKITKAPFPLARKPD